MSNFAVQTGGVGGAKLVDGYYRLPPRGSLTAVVITGDDFRHFRLPISPDIDTLLYTLSGKANAELGWGRAGETWNFMAVLRSMGGEDWFNLGDGDLALHVLRGAALAAGQSLSQVIRGFATAWQLNLAILPMTNDALETWGDSDEGSLPFQRYFVERQCRPKVRAIRFVGVGEVQAAPGVLEAIATADAILLAPSNPWLSIDPILSIAPMRRALMARTCPLVAVSPLIEGKSVKGPTGKLMEELGLEATNQTIAEHCAGLLDGMVIHGDDPGPEGMVVRRTDTLMRKAGDRIRVAQAVVDLAGTLSR